MSEAKDLIKAELKAAGLDLAEDSAVLAVRAVLKAIPKVVAATDNKIDDLLVPLLQVVEGPLLSLLDKIDGEEG